MDAAGNVTTFQLAAVLRDARAARYTHWELRVGGRKVGRYDFLVGKPQLEVHDLYFGPATAKRISAEDTKRIRRSVALEVRAVLNYGHTMKMVRSTLRPLDGRSLRLALHTGPY